MLQCEGYTLVLVNDEEYELVAQCTIQTLDDGAPFATVDSMQFASEAIDRDGLVLLLGVTEAEAAIERCKDVAEARIKLDAQLDLFDDESYDADNERKRRQEEWR